MHRAFKMNRRQLLLLLLFLSACIDRIDIGKSEADGTQIVVDGFISDEPKFHRVKLFRSSGTYDILSNPEPFSAKEVSISDDLGNREILREFGLGNYFTNGTYRGEVGRTYILRIEARDGRIYESSPETIQPSGTIDTVYYEFESFKPLSGPTESGFRIYMDSRGTNEKENFLRWRFTGTYKIAAFPELNTIGPATAPIPAPLSCCSSCWVVQAEDKPKVSKGQFVSDGVFRKVEVGYVPITDRSFQVKYMIEVEQMSLSRDAYNFWKTVQDQREGVGSLFQPPLGIPRTNIFGTRGEDNVQGIFYASSVARKIVFLTREDVRQFMSVPVAQQHTGSCLDFDGAQVFQPQFWVD